MTSAEAGTTRDSISVEITWQGREFRVYDTAGLRRRSRIEEKLEKLSVADALRAVRFAEVVVLMMDSQNKFEEQDLRIAAAIGLQPAGSPPSSAPQNGWSLAIAV
ncbi:MAG: GTPase [Terriglobales bacterium]